MKTFLIILLISLQATDGVKYHVTEKLNPATNKHDKYLASVIITPYRIRIETQNERTDLHVVFCEKKNLLEKYYIGSDDVHGNKLYRGIAIVYPIYIDPETGEPKRDNLSGKVILSEIRIDYMTFTEPPERFYNRYYYGKVTGKSTRGRKR